MVSISLPRLNWRKRQRTREISNYPPFPHLQNDFPVHWNWRSDSFCIRPRFQKGTNFLSRGIIWCIRVRNAFNVNWYDRFHLMNLLVQICWYLNDSPSLLQNLRCTLRCQVMLTMVTVEMEVVIMMIGRANLSKKSHKFHFHCFVTCLGILWLYCGLHGCNCGNDYHHYFTMIMMMIIIIIIILQWIQLIFLL